LRATRTKSLSVNRPTQESSGGGREIGYQLEHVQEGVDPNDWKPMSTVGPGV